ncbi:DUF4956 domain-containing protein [Pontimicrobium sp. MEBiC01747]
MQESLIELLIKLGINLVVSTLIIRFIYYKTTKKSEYLFTYSVISIIVFLLCFLLKNIQLQLGFALGLFAIFGIIRYRTTSINIKEMTYLFSIIGLSVINALTTPSHYLELILSNGIIVFIIWLLETVFKYKQITSTKINYTNLELLKLNDKAALKADIESRLQVTIYKLEVRSIDFASETAEINIQYMQ